MNFKIFKIDGKEVIINLDNIISVNTKITRALPDGKKEDGVYLHTAGGTIKVDESMEEVKKILQV
jgi:hypothetical protein